jgi:hypothetical protein
VAALVWFALALIPSFGWVGPGSAFLVWSAPALVIFVLTWWWLASAGARPRGAWMVSGLGAWIVLVAAAWDGGDRWLPWWCIPAVPLLLLGFPPALTVLMTMTASEVDDEPPAL